ncbi:HEAT repeat domain-containing protein [Actinomadura gamaensis]|uniref:HEAT repeat domain-containing protein n=1 Tax=Actinomadura gamaensis TaxID=1763541 RepID=A0ABV9TW73_9ACTN
MLAEIDDIDWASRTGAYGPAVEAPDILRAMASKDEETAAEGRDGFYSSLWHQGSVYPATTAAVPFLVELAVAPDVHERAELLFVLGALCDPAHSYGAEHAAVRAAVAARSDALVPLLADPDPLVREHAAYTVAHCGPHTRPALRRRWDVEREPQVRTSLVLGLALHEPDAEFLHAAVSEAFPVPVAAALALARARQPFPPEILPSVAAALVRDDVPQGPWWGGSRAVLPEVLDHLDGPTARALTAAATAGRPDATASHAKDRARVADALVTRFLHRRSAPLEAMPLLRELLNDPDPEAREAAVRAAAHAGRPAAAVADELTRIALGDPDSRTTGTALATLMRLDDPRWHQPVLREWAAGRDVAELRLLYTYPPAFDAGLLAAARRRLAAQLAEGLSGNPVIAVVNLLGAWGPAAAGAVPELVDALEAAPWAVPAVLGGMGPAARPALDALRRTADAGSVRAAHAVWRISRDPEPLVAAATRPSFWSKRGLDWDLNLVADAGPATAPLAPRALPLLTGAAAETYPDRGAQISAARLVWLATADPDPVLPTVAAVLDAGDVPARAAAALAAEMGPAASPLVPALRRTLDDEGCRVEAARALGRLGADPADVIAPLLAAAADPTGGRGADAVAALVEMRAVAAAPGLAELADRDERIVTAGGYDDLVWQDDRLRHLLRRAVTDLTSTT